VALEAAIRFLAVKHGFGSELTLEWSDRDVMGRGAARCAGYMAKYMTKAADEVFAHKWRRVDRCTGEYSEHHLRSWSASRKWGDTMKAIRERQRTWAASVASACAPACVRAGDAAGVALDLNSDRYPAPVVLDLVNLGSTVI
jgi:hypothetical protein